MYIKPMSGPEGQNQYKGAVGAIITGISDHYAIVKVADNTEIKIQKASVASVVPKDTFENA